MTLMLRYLKLVSLAKWLRSRSEQVWWSLGRRVVLMVLATWRGWGPYSKRSKATAADVRTTDFQGAMQTKYFVPNY